MSRSEDTRYCPGIAGMMHSGLCGKSAPVTFAEGNSYITLSDASPYRPLRTASIQHIKTGYNSKPWERTGWAARYG